MPTLSRTQAAEQMNRLFPWATWSAEDFGLFDITYELNGRAGLPFRMWLPVHAPNLQDVARYRLNLSSNADLRLARVDGDVEAAALRETERLPPDRQVCGGA